MKLISERRTLEDRYIVTVELDSADMEHVYSQARTSFIRQLLDRLQLRGSRMSDTLFFLAELALQREQRDPLPGPDTKTGGEGRGLPGGDGLPPRERPLLAGSGGPVRSLGSCGEAEHAEAEGSTPD